MHEAELVRGTEAAGVAREWISQWFVGSFETVDLQLAKLLATELVSNAVLHGEGQIMLRADLNEDRLLIEVGDEGDGLPAIREGRFEHGLHERLCEGEQGWGLKIVDAAASRWGVHEGTTYVWFEIERPGPRLGPENNPANKDNQRRAEATLAAPGDGGG
jgi:anti-sigma regulatory factor (Ser/Thr protein kinase)